jgi:hypothetical protein
MLRTPSPPILLRIVNPLDGTLDSFQMFSYRLIQNLSKRVLLIGANRG